MYIIPIVIATHWLATPKRCWTQFFASDEKERGTRTNNRALGFPRPLDAGLVLWHTMCEMVI